MGADPRIALRETIPTPTEIDTLGTELKRMDAASRTGPWTSQYLQTIGANEGVVAATLAEEVGVEKSVFKPRVRRLKELGLTESLRVGYKLSPRGREVLALTDTA